nr:LRR receptor-like serine/threonine-protein kinase FLS2 [Quercus suber]
MSKESLKSIRLFDNFLTSLGQHPILLPWTNLAILDLTSNNIQGSLPIPSSSTEQYLASHNSFNGKISELICNLSSLQVLELSENSLSGPLPQCLHNFETSFSGKLPASIGNLGSLTTISMWGCNFSGFIPSTLGNLTRLNFLDLSYNTYEGRIPSSFGNLIQLSFLFLTKNKFTGPIPFEFANLTKLTALSLGGNEFAGQIPSSIFNHTNLEFLGLSNNYFSGTVEFDKFTKLKKLTTLYLSGNQLSLIESETSANRTIPKFVTLGLSSCNLSKFPNFLANQDKLELLELQGNNIHGQVPEWV